MHIEWLTHCRICAAPLHLESEALEPLSGLLISESVCPVGHRWIGSRRPLDGAVTPHEGDQMDAVMTAETTTDRQPVTERYAKIALTQLAESVHNPRTHFDQVKLAELADSIRQKGIVEPLVVRLAGGGEPDWEDVERFEIVAGARRFRAATLAGLDTVPCIVRDYSDEDVLEIFVVENMQRDDLSPLEQARGFKQLLTANADRFTVATIAGKVGMSPAWVWDRIKLLDLVPEAQDLLESGRITVGHAIVIARQKADDQTRIIDAATGGLWAKESVGLAFEGEESELVDDYQDLKPKSIRELEAWITEHVRFDVEHMAQAVPLVFTELAEQVREERQAPGRGKKVISITFNHFTQPDARDDADRTYGPQSWRRADGQEGSKQCFDAVLGVVVVGPRQGRSMDVCIARDKCRVHFGEEIAAKEKAAKARAKGDTKTAKKIEKKQEQSWERQQRERDERRKVWEPQKGPVLAAAIDQVKTLKALTPKQAAYFEDQGEFYITTSDIVRVLGKKWYLELAAAALVSEVSKGNYVEGFDDFVKEYAEPLGLNLKPLIAARDANTAALEAQAPLAKKARGRK
jgi:ParB/RepB/Spo0J family partition protein